MNKTVICKTCGAEIAKTAKRCPKCGAQQHVGALIACSIIIVIVIIFIIFVLANWNSKGNQEVDAKMSEEIESSNENVIYEKDEIKITYTGMKLTQYLENQPDGYMLTVSLNVENKSSKDITVYPVDSSVNGVMKTAISAMPLTILSGKKSVAGFSFANLEGTGIDSADDIDNVKEIEFRLSIKNSNTFNEIFKSDVITISP